MATNRLAHPDALAGIPEGTVKIIRRAFRERYADGKTLVFGTHFAIPSPGGII